MTETKQNSLGTEPIGRLLLKFSVPTALTLMVNCLYNIVDQIFIGHAVGIKGVAATNVTFPIGIIAAALALLIGDGCAANVSLHLGRGEQEEADRTFANAVMLLFGVTDVIENRQAVHVRFENEESSSGGMCDLLSDRNRDQIEAALVSGTLPQDSHSIALDMEYAEDMIGVEAGSVIKLSIGDQEIPVTVSGLFLNDGLQNGHGPLALDNTCMVATKELFQEAMPMIDCFDYSWSIVSDPQKAEQIENSLSAIISSDPDLALDTIGIHKDYEEMENRVVFGGFQALSWLVFLFGVVNLINTTLSNQISRKRENSVFRAIGLTRKQLCQMTIYEGICYAFFAALATLAAGLPIAVIAARKFSEMTFHGVIMPYSFPFLQMGLFVLVLFGLEVILSFWTMRRQKNQSLVEEMRAME